MPVAIPAPDGVRRRSIGAAAALVLLLVAAACSGGGHGSGPVPRAANPQREVRRAASATQQADRMTLVLDATFSLGARTQRLKATGAFDYDQHFGTATIGLSGDGRSVSVHEVIRDGQVYVRSPQLRPVLHGKTWGRGSVKRFEQSGVYDSPRRTLDVLYAFAGARRVRDAGTGVVDGDPVRRYTMSIDYDRAQSQLGPAKAQRLLRAFSVRGPHRTITATVAVTADHRVRQFDIKGEAGGLVHGEYRGEVDTSASVPEPDAPPAGDTRRISPSDLAAINSPD